MQAIRLGKGWGDGANTHIIIKEVALLAEVLAHAHAAVAAELLHLHSSLLMQYETGLPVPQLLERKTTPWRWFAALKGMTCANVRSIILSDASKARKVPRP